MNVIIWIDGANGVGKSHIANALADNLSYMNAEYIESDLCWYDLIQENFLLALTGFEPYYNVNLHKRLRKIIDEKINDFGKMPIVSMSLVDKSCKENLLDYYEEKNEPMIHVILEAREEIILSRIENDPIREESHQEQQKPKVAWQMKYLKDNYPGAIRIDTEDKSCREIVDEIIICFKEKSLV